MALTKIDDRGLNTPIDLLDNEKIRFGTDTSTPSNLEIYHDGSTSRLHSATDSLYIRTGNIFAVYNGAGNEEIIRGIQNEACELYYDGGTNPKLKTQSHGVNITDGELRIGDASDGNDALIRLGATGTDVDTHGVIYYDKSSNYLSLVVAGESHGGGGILIANGGNVGIGTDDPLKKLHIASAGDVGLMLQTTNATNDKEIWEIGCGANASSEAELTFRTRVNAGTGGSEAMRIASGGQICIGTTDGPGEPGLYLGDGTNPAAHIYANGTHHLYILANAYYNGSWKYQGAGEAGSLTISDGALTYNTASAGTAGNNITWAEVFQAKANGDLEIHDGNLKLGSSHGIMFHPHDAAVSSPGSDSNLLDDYEEGTFNPTLRGHDGSWSEVTFDSVIRYGWYTKIGNVCRVWIRFYNFHIDSGFDGDLAAIGGLPFSSSNTAYKENILSISNANAFAESGVYNIALDYNTNTGITRLISGTGSGYSTWSGSTGRYLTISGSYSVG